ncbi:MAG: potassium transporter Kup [Hyphomicrobiaceae bacterium]|nr:potassium transporter Kup [Hyphomicrobiaceae bacterium]
MAQASATTASSDADHAPAHGKVWVLALGSIGVVYGDIGTSPLYAFKEAVTHAMKHGLAGHDAVLGVLSLIIWALLLVVTLKYVIVLLRADNKGEGGTFALMALGQSVAKRSAPVLFALGVMGVSFFYGDALLTPAISVLSAVEGLKLVAPGLASAVVPLSMIIIIGLFAMQARGTERVAAYFGPITLVWFLLLAAGGVSHIIDDVGVFGAFNPLYGVNLLVHNGLLGLAILGLVFLAVTGAEALYADLGHFGRVPIQWAWSTVVLPCLVLNYLGQGALVLANPTAIANPFYLLYPSWALIPMVLMATAATVIASQAVITGAFSITRQAVQLGLLPRLGIRHTSESVAGQIYMPRVNWMLLVGVLLVVGIFQESSRLASAYGISVTATMAIDSVMAFFVVWKYWGWSLWRSLLLIVPLLFIEQAFLMANMLKILDGGWFPLLIALTLALLMFTWVRGSKVLARSTKKNEAEIDWLVRHLEAKPPHRVPGTAVFLTGDPYSAPSALMHNLKHNRVLHERNILLTIKTEDTPRVPRHERIQIERISDGFIRVIAHYGFMESPSVAKIFEHARRKDLNVDFPASSFFLSRRSLKPTTKTPMPRWQEMLFIKLAAQAEDATEYFRIPPDRVVEVGTQIQV